MSVTASSPLLTVFAGSLPLIVLAICVLQNRARIDVNGNSMINQCNKSSILFLRDKNHKDLAAAVVMDYSGSIPDLAAQLNKTRENQTSDLFFLITLNGTHGKLINHLE